MLNFTEVVLASSIWPNAKDYVDKGERPGLVRGYNVEINKNGEIGWMSASWIHGTPEDYFDSDFYRWHFEDMGAVPTGRIAFRGYGREEWDLEERDDVVILCDEFGNDIEEYVMSENDIKKRNILETMRSLKSGDRLTITIYDGPSGEALVRSVNDDGITIKWVDYTMCYEHTSLANEIMDITKADIEEHDIVAELEVLEPANDEMYCIIKTDVLCGAGGESVSMKIYKKSRDKKKLESVLLEKLKEALENDQVEFINYDERSEIKNIEDVYLTNELYIQYEGDGWDWESERYKLIIDDAVEE